MSGLLLWHRIIKTEKNACTACTDDSGQPLKYLNNIKNKKCIQQNSAIKVPLKSHWYKHAIRDDNENCFSISQ